MWQWFMNLTLIIFFITTSFLAVMVVFHKMQNVSSVMLGNEEKTCGMDLSLKLLFFQIP